MQKYCERRGAGHVTAGVTVACKLMRACSRDLPQLLVSLRSMTTFLLLHAQAACNLQGMLLLQEFSEHRHSSSSAILHTFNRDVCALMAKDCSPAGVQPADCAAVHGASSALHTAFGARLRLFDAAVQPLPCTPRCCWLKSCAMRAAQ